MHALNNVGTAELRVDMPGGREKLERSLALALDAGMEEHVARAYCNLASMPVQHYAHATVSEVFADGVAYCVSRDLDSWRLYMVAWRAVAELQRWRL